MLIAHIMFTVSEIDRDTALNVLLSETAQVRLYKGCMSYFPFADPTNTQSLGVMQEWETEVDFENYLSSAIFTRIGAALRPMMVAPPVSRRFDSQLIIDIN